jgi:hypothetical protein
MGPMQVRGLVTAVWVLVTVTLPGCDAPDCPGNAVAPAVRFDFSRVAHVGPPTDIRACVEQQCRSSAYLPQSFHGGTVYVVWNDLSGRPVSVSLHIRRQGLPIFSATATVTPSQTEPYGHGCGHVWMAAVQASGTGKLKQVSLDPSDQ